jgi:hypothetical protein
MSPWLQLPPPSSEQLEGRHMSPRLQHPPPAARQLRGCHVSPWLLALGSSRGDTCPRGSDSGGSAQLRPDRCGGGVIGAVAGSGGSRIGRRQLNHHGNENLTTSVAVAIWRAHNSNLILRRGRRSDVDGRQGDAIPISDQVKQKTQQQQIESFTLRAKHMPTAADPACTQIVATSLWLMLWTAAPAVVDRRSCDLISAATM